MEEEVPYDARKWHTAHTPAAKGYEEAKGVVDLGGELPPPLEGQPIRSGLAPNSGGWGDAIKFIVTMAIGPLVLVVIVGIWVLTR